MLMTDQVHLAAQLEAEFTLAPRSFSFSLYPLTCFYTHPPLLVSFSHHISTLFSAVCLHVCVSVSVCVSERGVKVRVMAQLCF